MLNQIQIKLDWVGLGGGGGVVNQHWKYSPGLADTRIHMIRKPDININTSVLHLTQSKTRAHCRTRGPRWKCLLSMETLWCVGVMSFVPKTLQREPLRNRPSLGICQWQNSVVNDIVPLTLIINLQKRTQILGEIKKCTLSKMKLPLPALYQWKNILMIAAAVTVGEIISNHADDPMFCQK